MKQEDIIIIATIVLTSLSGIMFSDGFTRLFLIDPLVEMIVAVIIISALVTFNLHFMKRRK